jgi:transcriptional regulator with XRE-family HTH domain
VNTDPSSSPPAFFAAEVKRLRGIAGMTQEELAKATVYSAASVAAIETCRLIPSKQFAEFADKAFQTDGHLARLQELVEQMSVLPWFRDRIEVERKATDIRTYEPYQVPGLLQIEEYARANVTAARPMLSDDEIDRAVALRMSRQEILLDESDPPNLWAIMDESALQRVVGSQETMAAQREHLLDMFRRPNITAQIIPNSEGSTCAYGRAFDVLTTKNDASLVYLEDIGSARYVRDRHEVRRYMVVFDHLRANALTDRDSVEFIKGMMR